MPWLQALDVFYSDLEGETDFIENRTLTAQILQKEDDLNEIVQLVGKDSLGESDKIGTPSARRASSIFSAFRNLKLAGW